MSGKYSPIRGHFDKELKTLTFKKNYFNYKNIHKNQWIKDIINRKPSPNELNFINTK